MSRKVAWKGRSMPNARWFRWKPSAIRSQMSERLRGDLREVREGRAQDGEPLREGLEDAAERLGHPARRASQQPLHGAHHALRVRVESEEEDEHDEGPHARRRPAELDQVRQASLDLRRGGGEDEEVEGEEHEDGDEVDEPLEDDRGEPGGRGDRVASRDEPGAQQLARAGDEEPRGEADHRRGEEVGVPHPPERGEEVPPAPGAHRVDRERDEDEAGQGKRPGAPEGLAEGAPVDPAEEQGEQGSRQESPDEEPSSLPLHRLSGLLTKSFRSNT